jgi:hypothetical protein
MPSQNYNLYLPDRNDDEYVDETLKSNFNIIDEELKKREEALTLLNNFLTERVENIQMQLNVVVVEGSIDPQVAQARVNSFGIAYATLQARLALADLNYLNVKMFGAIGDGNSHPLSERYNTLEEAQVLYPFAVALSEEIDRCAIQAALNYVMVNASYEHGADVRLAPGTYMIDKNIKTYANVTLKGVGRRGSTLKLTPNSLATAVIIREGGVDGYWVQLRDFCINGQASLQTVAADGILLEDAAEALIDNVGIRNIRGNSIKVTRKSTTSIQPTINKCIIRADKDNHAVDAAGIYLDYGSYDGVITDNDIGYYKNGYGLRLNQHNGSKISGNNAWQCKTGYRFENANRFRMSDNLSDYAQEYGFYFNGCTEFQMSNNQSRWSSCKTPMTYDGVHFYGCSDWLLNGMAIFSGDGVASLPGIGTGRTAFGLALTGGGGNGRIGNLLAKNCTGEIFRDVSVTNIKRMSEVAV